MSDSTGYTPPPVGPDTAAPVQAPGSAGSVVAPPLSGVPGPSLPEPAAPQVPAAPAPGAAAPATPAVPSASEPPVPSAPVPPLSTAAPVPQASAPPGVPASLPTPTRPVAPMAAPAPQPTVSSAPPMLPPVAAPGVGATSGAAAWAPTPYRYGAAPEVQTAPDAATTASGEAPRTRAEGKKPGAGGMRVAGILLAAAMVGGVAAAGTTWAMNEWVLPTKPETVAGPTTVTVNNEDDVDLNTAIASKALPSVVTIEAASRTAGGTGSGVIISSSGYVVTNTHVVTLDGASANPDIRATTSDGRVFDAKIVGLDPTYDLAVIQLVDASGLTPMEFADSGELNVGDKAVAVGAPLGLANTVTTGIVSALNRSIEIASSAVPDTNEDEDVTPDDGSAPFRFDFGDGAGGAQATESIAISVIQTDAAINPGNSGGALVDSEGKLIGINVAIASAGNSSAQAGSIGVGFSIPSDVVRRISDELIDTGVATHGLLGASVRAAAYVDGATHSGAYIAEVTPGGAAADAGLRAGDVVIEFNGSPVTSSVDLTAQVRAVSAGSEASVTYLRDGESETVTTTLGSLSE